MSTLNIIGRGRGRGHGLKADGVKWTCNYFTPGMDAIFFMHHPWVTADKQQEEKKKTIDAGIKIYDLDTYPIGGVQRQFKTKFFGNSICYMIALGLYIGYKKISLWGCNIIPGPVDEPIVKNHFGIEFWIGYAMGMGVDVHIQGNSYIMNFKDGRYGYDWPKQSVVISSAENGAPY